MRLTSAAASVTGSPAAVTNSGRDERPRSTGTAELRSAAGRDYLTGRSHALSAVIVCRSAHCAADGAPSHMWSAPG
jgi:hypothetical protein